ncbi:hypothetical protein [Kitasatospora terrestris]|uniref:Uncharacterized protein n=1 Tax=Kitasatospora terrestris TaxID=258051 RepID=A0ABP9DKE7_9ACTN
MANSGAAPRALWSRAVRELYRMLSNAGAVQYALPMPPVEEPAAADPRPAPVRERVPVG